MARKPFLGDFMYYRKQSRLERWLRRVPLVRRFLKPEAEPVIMFQGNDPIGVIVGRDEDGSPIIQIGGTYPLFQEGDDGRR